MPVLSKPRLASGINQLTITSRRPESHRAPLRTRPSGGRKRHLAGLGCGLLRRETDESRAALVDVSTAKADSMPHPHAEATYRVITSGDAAFASIPGTYPAKVSPFATKADAEAWIAEHRRRVQSENEPSRWFRSSGTSGSKRRGGPG